MDILLPTLLRFLALSIRIALNLESIPVDHMGKIQREREILELKRNWVKDIVVEI